MNAEAAGEALREADYGVLENYLAAYRGDSTFAYYFASDASPRAVGDALGVVSSKFDGEQFSDDFDSEAYALLIPDLAGVLSYAVSATSDQKLRSSWTEAFIAATTQPEKLGPAEGDVGHSARLKKDEANKQNLLLVLANGSWPTSFLKSVARAYLDFDKAEGEKAWPGVQNGGEFYAPAASGLYLTDGMVALSAALTSNAEASEWAFTELEPGTQNIEGSEYVLGRFTHYLMFEHSFPKGIDGTDLGVTVAMTALAAASGVSAESVATENVAAASEPGPLRDAQTLTAFASDLKESASPGCSWKVYDCVVTAVTAIANLAKWVWDRIARWGHLVLDVVAAAAFVVGPVVSATGIGAAGGIPIMFIGVAATLANAGWYAIEGDYLMAGVSLAAVVPGIGFTKLASSVKGTTAARAVDNAVVAASGGVAAHAHKVAASMGDQISVIVNSWRTKRLAILLNKSGVRVAVNKLPKKRAYSNESDFQDDVRKVYSDAQKERHLKTDCKKTCEGNRRVDIFDTKSKTCIEVKIGVSSSNFSHERNEIQKDVLLRKNKTCNSIVWLFGPGKDGKVGPHERLEMELKKARIPYVSIGSALA